MYEDECTESVEQLGIDGFPTAICVRGRKHAEFTLDELESRPKIERVEERKTKLEKHFAFVKCEEGLRENNVSARADDVWSFRGGRDLYGGGSRGAVSSQEPQVDHILEIQVVNLAWCSALADGVRTRGAKESIQLFVNDLPNLNVTSKVINQAKKGPFIRFLKKMVQDGDHPWASGTESTLEELARKGAPSVRRLVDSGSWAKIEQAVQNTKDSIVATVDSHRDSVGVQGQRFAEHLEDLVAKMNLGV